MIPDGEAVVIAYLDGLLVEEVSTETPRDRKQPWVRVTQLDAPEGADGVDHLIEFWFQLDCCAGTQGDSVTATDLARKVRAELAVIDKASHAGAVVTAKEITGDARIDDEDFEPAMPRRVIEVSVWMHS